MGDHCKYYCRVVQQQNKIKKKYPCFYNFTKEETIEGVIMAEECWIYSDSLSLKAVYSIAEGYNHVLKCTKHIHKYSSDNAIKHVLLNY